MRKKGKVKRNMEKENGVTERMMWRVHGLCKRFRRAAKAADPGLPGEGGKIEEGDENLYQEEDKCVWDVR